MMLRQNIIILTTESYQESKAGVIYSKGGVVLKCEVLFTSTCATNSKAAINFFFFFKEVKLFQEIPV